MTVLPTAPIGREEFERRLAKLCLTADGQGFPKRTHDRWIVLKAATLGLSPDRTYTEPEINAALADWLDGGGSWLESDHVSLRRELVDEAFLDRDPGGSWYRLGPAAGDPLRFARDLAQVDFAGIVRAARAGRAARRRDHQERESR